MAYMLMLILEQPEHLKPVLDSWQALGVEEISYVESTQAHLHAQPKAHIPIRFMFEPVSGESETTTLTLFAVLTDESMVQACIDASEDVVGDLDSDSSVWIAAWPLPIVKGLHKP